MIHIPIYERHQGINNARQTFAALGVGGTAALAGTLASTGVGVASSLGAFGGGQSGASAGAAGFPQYQGNFRTIDNVAYNPAQIGADLNAVYPSLQAAAGKATNYATKQREKIFPGSGAIFNDASNIIQSYLAGQVPQDVVDQTNRITAERLGGAWNPFTGGGQAGPAFARSIGQTSLGLQQAGLSAAPTWQQLAQSFITMPQDFAPLAMGLANQRYSYDALNTGINQFNEEGRLGVLANQYAAGANQYGAQQAANYQQAQQGQNLAGTLMAGAGTLGDIGLAYNQGKTTLPGTASGTNYGVNFTPAAGSRGSTVTTPFGSS